MFHFRTLFAYRGRRKISYPDYDSLLADVRTLSSGPYRTVGGWTFAQILSHLASAIESSVDGFEFKWPLYVRIFVKVCFIKPLSLVFGFPAGLKVAKAGEPYVTVGPDVELDAAVERFEKAIEKRRASTNTPAHPALGNMSLKMWTKFHLRHAELHLSFVVPEERAATAAKTAAAETTP